MGKIFFVMGKSASGKDTLYKRLLAFMPELNRVVPYTTRPIRQGEKEGVEYHFVTVQQLEDLKSAGKVIESRTYQTVMGPWSYFTVDDQQFEGQDNHYLMIGTLESYEKIRNYFGKDRVVPLYIQVENGLRLERAIQRERMEKHPKYAELCRRFLADEEDFSADNLSRCEITAFYDNHNLEQCVNTVAQAILFYFAEKG